MKKKRLNFGNMYKIEWSWKTSLRLSGDYSGRELWEKPSKQREFQVWLELKEKNAIWNKASEAGTDQIKQHDAEQWEAFEGFRKRWD